MKEWVTLARNRSLGFAPWFPKGGSALTAQHLTANYLPPSLVSSLASLGILISFVPLYLNSFMATYAQRVAI